MKHYMAMAVCVALARYMYAGSFFPLPSTNAIVLNFDNEIPEAVRETIRLDFDRCLLPSVSEIELYHSDRDPTNRMSIAGLWQSYGCLAAKADLVQICQKMALSRMALSPSMSHTASQQIISATSKARRRIQMKSRRLTLSLNHCHQPTWPSCPQTNCSLWICGRRFRRDNAQLNMRIQFCVIEGEQDILRHPDMLSSLGNAGQQTMHLISGAIYQWSIPSVKELSCPSI